MEIILQIVKFGIIFGALATAPIITWLAVSWMLTERKRTSSRPNAG